MRHVVQQSGRRACRPAGALPVCLSVLCLALPALTARAEQSPAPARDFLGALHSGTNTSVDLIEPNPNTNPTQIMPPRTTSHISARASGANRQYQITTTAEATTSNAVKTFAPTYRAML